MQGAALPVSIDHKTIQIVDGDPNEDFGEKVEVPWIPSRVKPEFYLSTGITILNLSLTNTPECGLEQGDGKEYANFQWDIMVTVRQRLIVPCFAGFVTVCPSTAVCASAFLRNELTLRPAQNRFRQVCVTFLL